MSRAERDRRAGAMLKARAATLRELAREAKRLGLPKAQETTRQARLDTVADLAQLGGELYSVPADLIDRSDTSPKALKAKSLLLDAFDTTELVGKLNRSLRGWANCATMCSRNIC